MAALGRPGDIAAMKFGARTTAEEALRGISLNGKTTIVTGASAGIGVETARVLALAGAEVIMGVRNLKGGEAVAETLRRQLPASAGRLEVWPLDLSDLESVNAFAQRFLATGRALHVLVNNAGVMATPPGATAQGYELQVGTNHLGHFALTTALLPALQKSAPSRIVNVSSKLHTRGDGERLMRSLEKRPAPYSRFDAYGDSKLANVLFTRELAKRLPQGVDAFAVHPGVVRTSLARNMGFAGRVYSALMNTVLRPFTKSVEQGAATTIFAATAPELGASSGAYLEDCRVSEPIAAALDTSLAQRVWNVSQAAVA